MLSQGEWWRKDLGEGGGDSKHAKGTINHQLHKFTPLGHLGLSDRNVFCTLRGRGKRRGLMPLGLFLIFFGWSLAPDLRFSLGQQITCCKLSVNVSNIFGRLAPIRQNLNEKRCRKLLRMPQGNKNLFDKSKDKDASKL